MSKSPDIFRVVPVINNGKTLTTGEPLEYRRPSALNEFARKTDADYLVIDRFHRDDNQPPHSYKLFIKARLVELSELKKVAPRAARWMSAQGILIAALTRRGKVLVEFREGRDEIFFPKESQPSPST